jgi:DNA-binding response OmpR family regulator
MLKQSRDTFSTLLFFLQNFYKRVVCGTDSRRSWNKSFKERIMRCILIMEDFRELGVSIWKLLERAGYRVIYVSDQEEAMKILNPFTMYPDRIDFIWSAGLYWQNCYKLAIDQYGKRNVIVFTASKEIANEVELLGVKSFEKPMDPKILVEYIKKCCPPD